MPMTNPTDPTEAEFQAAVIELAERTGWKVAHFADSRKQIRGRDGELRLVGDEQAKGYPDLTMVKGRRLMFVELKRDGQHPTETQMVWLSALSDVSEATRDRQIHVAVWHPEDMRSGLIARELTRQAAAVAA